jgi:hypothetical protein
LFVIFCTLYSQGAYQESVKITKLHCLGPLYKGGHTSLPFPLYLHLKLMKQCIYTLKHLRFFIMLIIVGAVVIVLLLDLQLPMQSVSITTNVVSSNPAQVRCTRYNIIWSSLSVTCDRSVVFSIQHKMIKFISDLRQVGDFLYTTLCDKVCQWLATSRWFSPGIPISPPIKRTATI